MREGNDREGADPACDRVAARLRHPKAIRHELDRYAKAGPYRNRRQVGEDGEPLLQGCHPDLRRPPHHKEERQADANTNAKMQLERGERPNASAHNEVRHRHRADKAETLVVSVAEVDAGGMEHPGAEAGKDGRADGHAGDTKPGRRILALQTESEEEGEARTEEGAVHAEPQRESPSVHELYPQHHRHRHV